MAHLAPTRILILTAFFLCGGCTTKDPNYNPNQPKNQVRQILVEDQLAKTSLIPFLINHPKELKLWESNSGLSAFFGGDLFGALDIFDEQFDDLTFPSQLGWVRSHLELAEAYTRLNQLSSLLFSTWVKSEKERPNAQIHKPWYDWLEWIQGSSTPPSSLSQNEGLKNWLSLKNLETAEFPQGVDSHYRKWVSFTKAVRTQNLKKAARLLKKLKLNTPMYIAEGQDDVPALAVHDPRVITSLVQYHSSQALKVSQKFKGVARSLYIQSLLYLNRDQEALDEIDRLLQSQELDSSKANSVSLLIASENGSWVDWLNQQKAFKVQALVRLGRTSDAQSFFKNWIKENEPRTSSTPATLPLKDLTSPTLMSTLWMNVGASWLKISTLDPILKNLRHLNILIEQRKDFSEQFLEMLEKHTQPQHRSYVISTQILTRWIDRMQLRYGESLLRTDQRVFAISALQGAEDSTAPMRRKNRNRIDLLITTTQANYIMNRHRTALKYLTRMRDDLPGCLFVLEMMSDLLSKKGSTIESNVNGGQ